MSLFMCRPASACARLVALSVVLLSSLPAPAAAEVTSPTLTVAKIFSDSMVVQRDSPIPVWGWAAPGTTVTVELAASRAQAAADATGKWMARLPALPAGGPHTMTISADRRILIPDVLVGDVWLCSGQSNMNWPLKKSLNGDKPTVGADNPRLRLLTVPNRISLEPQADLATARWKASTPETAPGFSAVAWFFGQNLQQHLDVPIGLIHASWGGSDVVAWTSEDTLAAEPDSREEMLALKAVGTDPKKVAAWWKKHGEAWDQKAEALDAGSSGSVSWADPSVDTADWDSIEVPMPPAGNRAGTKGILWLRRDVQVPASLAGKAALLSLGRIADRDITWVNGVQVGKTDRPQTARSYRIPEGVLREGTNTVTVRVWNPARKGSIGATGDQLHLSDAALATSVPLAGTWKQKTGADFSSLPLRGADPLSHNRPGALFNGMISPLVPFALKGAIWYQGENNVFHAWSYRNLFQALIRDWRTAWGAGDFPFLYVQLPNFEALRNGSPEGSWPEVREAQAEALALPSTGMAIAIDQGDPLDIHPTRKDEVARRLFLAARRVAYGEPIVASGPLYRKGSARAEDGAMHVKFDSVGGGLGARDGQLRGFEIAGRDRVFHPAQAAMEGEEVKVYSPAVPAPVAVRYAWSNNPDCNLINREGLPASPFRTDTWPLSQRPGPWN